MAKLILVRHGKSEWNKLGLWTGHTDVELNDEGFVEAKQAGELIKDIPVHRTHVSALTRAKQTLAEIKKVLGLDQVVEVSHPALNERDYGVHTGKNKWQVKEELGEEQFQKVRRGWDVPIPGGETLKDVHDRAVPYYQDKIEGELKAGHNVLVVAHGNTLRALIKHLDKLDEEAICDVEVATGEVHCYDIDAAGAVVGKEIRGHRPNLV